MSRAADSAGIPFDGREFRPHPFAGDDGSAPERLGEALADWARNSSSGAYSEVVESLRDSRLLVPLIAEAGDVGHTPEGRLVEKTQELSVVTVEGPDSQPVGVVFSDVESLARWRLEARPQPVEALRAAAWALQEGVTRLVLNPTSASECVLRRGALVALVTAQPYTPPWEDPEVIEAIESGLGGQGVLLSVRSGWDEPPQPGADLIVEVGLEPGLTSQELSQLHSQWSGAWGQETILNQRVDGLRLAIIAL